MDIIQMSINQGTNKQIDTYQNTTQQGKGMMQQLILQSSMLNERSQTQKSYIARFHWHEIPRTGKPIEKGSVAQGWGSWEEMRTEG